MAGLKSVQKLPSDTVRTQMAYRHVAAVWLAAVVSAGLGGCADATAAPESAAAARQSKTEQPAAAVATVDLGETSLRQTRTLENSTVNVRFRAHAVTTPANAKRLEKVLQLSEHQAREQMIVAVRTAETWEFDEPELGRLRRRIQLRLNRWLDAPLVDDVVLTDFRFRLD